MKNKNVLISGAGIAGLTLAYWLKRHGFAPTLVERHPTLRSGGYKIDIRGAALEVIKRMEADSSIFESRTDIQGATIVDSGGKHLTKMSGDLCGSRAEGDLEIMRGDLCQILLKQVADVECLFGDSITHISQNQQGVHVEFERNKPRPFDLVVGADGLHSIVRKLVFGDESNFLQNLGLYISVFTIPNFLNLDRWEIEYHEPKKFVNVYSTRGDLNAKAGFAFSSKSLQFDPRNTEQQQKLLEDAFAGVGWEVPRLLAAMKETSDFYFDSIAQIHMPHWTEGRTALIGDAGYAPSPLSGQGTSLAIVGAYVLAGELAEAQGDHVRAFSRYEKLLSKFVIKNQKLAQMSAKVMAGTETSSIAWLHHHLMRLMPESWIHFLKRWGLKRISKAANAVTLKTYSNFE
jgi:2-polyprenyl-6-methoxyphenol hydroxylase-like FAD-dependent oxidoreductase